MLGSKAVLGQFSDFFACIVLESHAGHNKLSGFGILYSIRDSSVVVKERRLVAPVASYDVLVR